VPILKIALHQKIANCFALMKLHEPTLLLACNFRWKIICNFM